MSIEIKDVSYIYGENTPFEKKAIADIHLSIDKHEFIGLIGHTGSGKSTLIQHFNGLLKPTKGSIFFNGENIHKDGKTLRRVRQKVGLVFQYPEHQLFEMTVYKDVAFGPENMGLSKEEVDKRVKNAVKMVGLQEDIYDQSPFDLSGGQKRRVAIAGVLAMEPKVLVLDEPTAGLDPKGRDDILDQIQILQKTMGITVILVSHSMEDVAKYVGRIIVMDQGKIQIDDVPKKVFLQVEMLEKVGLGIPQITYLMHALKDTGFDVPLDTLTVKEAVPVIKKIIKQVQHL